MTSPCIQLNPDIAGIGVRISVYAQAFLLIARLFVFIMDGIITESERLAIDEIFISSELMACSLLVSGFIQVGTYGLTVYHANILLALSWITVLPLLSVPTQFFRDFIHTIALTGGPQTYRKSAKMPIGSILQGIILATHYITVVAFGVWIWSNVDSFGSQPECTSQTFLVVFGSNVLVGNHGLKIAALCLYGAIAFFASAIAFAIPCILFQYHRNTRSRPSLGRGTIPGPGSSSNVSRRNDGSESLDLNRDRMQERGQPVQSLTSVSPSSNRGTPPRTTSSSDGILETQRSQNC